MIFNCCFILLPFTEQQTVYLNFFKITFGIAQAIQKNKGTLY